MLKDIERLSKIKNNKKVFADSAVITTAMLKNCVRVPHRYIKDPDNPDNLENLHKEAITQAEYDKIQERESKIPFKRGSMAFEDYNYSLYNKYILKDPDNLESENEETIMKRL